MADKLTIINSELAKTGNNLVPAPDDGSDEWIVCSAAYDDAVDSTIEKHSWNFETTTATVQRLGDSPDDLYDDAFAKPNGCLHLIWVRINDQPTDYKIINNQICLTANNYPVIVKYVADNPSVAWPSLFTDIIRAMVRSAIYRGLHEDPGTADREEAKAQMALQEARTRIDQESPKRAPFNSRARSARFTRRPFIRTPHDFGGTGVPD